jgi:hypothetical protein
MPSAPGLSLSVSSSFFLHLYACMLLTEADIDAMAAS